MDSLHKDNHELLMDARKRCDVDLLHSDVVEIEEWLEMRILDEHKARRLRDVLLRLYPLSCPRCRSRTTMTTLSWTD
jgi:hypothetical protein